MFKHSFRPCLEQLEERCTPTTYLVGNLNDAGRGSLRQAVVNANKHAGPDTIVFKDGLEGTIKLTSGKIDINGALFLDGPGANKITIDGNRYARFFSVVGPTTMNVTIDGLTLFNGSVAVFNNAKLNLVGVVVTGNSGFYGGAVENEGMMTILKSRIAGNEAQYGGGGIYNVGNILIDQSTITGNRCDVLVPPDSPGGGAGIFHWLGSLTLRRSIVSGNISARDGGGIHAGSSTDKLIIEKSTIEGNQAGRWGGGVITAAASNTITDTKIRYNRSESTGGGLASNTPTAIKRSTISGNSSRTGPAGGLSQYGGSLTMIDSTVSGNSALSHEGGGIYLAATTAASTIRRSTIAGNWAADGGGVSVVNVNAPVLFQNSTISGNVAEARGGGIFVSGASSDKRVTIQNSTIAFNRAGDSGGIVAGSPVTLESSIVANNDAVSNPDMMSFSGNQFFALKSSLISTVLDPAIYTSDGTNLFGVDPRLAPLASNGGLTQTHALKRGSPAINRGSNPAKLTTDQRAGLFKRLLGKAVDIGAFERE